MTSALAIFFITYFKLQIGRDFVMIKRMETETKPIAEKKQRGRPSMRDEEKKKSTSFYLSDDTRDDLKALAIELRLSQASVIETLVRTEAKRRGVKATAATNGATQ